MEIFTFTRMELFSLEEDECPELFITQNSSENMNQSGNKSVIGDEMDFQSPCVSLVNVSQRIQNQYSDISDDDFDPFPSSQKHENSTVHDRRCV